MTKTIEIEWAMTASEKFIEMPMSFSDKKIIANDLAHLFANIRYGKANIAYLIVVTIIFMTSVKNVYFIPIVGIFVLGFCLLMTKYELVQEFKSRHKLVGTFVIIRKQHFRKYLFETKNTYIIVPKPVYDQVNLYDVVHIEKLPNGRILSCKKVIENHNPKPVL